MGSLSPTLAVRNMKQTIEFYKDSLGFELGMCFPNADNPEYAALAKDGVVLMFIPAENLGIGSEKKLGIGVDLYMQIDGDIDEYYHELRSRRVEMLLDIKDEPYGIRDFTVEDVNGYKLTFNQLSRPAEVCTTCEVPMIANCLSCGMPMTGPGDFGGGNPESKYCVHCSNPDGSLKSYEEVLEGMVNFMMTSQKMEREAAESAAKEYMSKMPAWSGD
jgi:uncharacterized glyoxalase superfamily protein PhnB